MLKTRSGLSRPVLGWMSQVAASLGATLAAALIWSVVPHPGASPPPPPELTSGGKFAARIVDAVAYDGLDTMPAPHVAPAPRAAEAAGSAEATRRIVWDGPPPVLLAPDRFLRAVRPAHPATRAEPRRVAAEARQPVIALAALSPAAEPAGEEGFLDRTVPQILPTIASTARGVWAVTAAAGGSLVSRVVPQVP